MNRMAYTAIRRATTNDLEAIRELGRAASRALCVPDYTPEQVETALRSGVGVSQQVIEDGTYYVIEDNRQIIAGGGWSCRAALWSDPIAHGETGSRPEEVLDPTIHAARLRGFCVHPDHARRGLGRTLLGLCERAAAHAGYTRLELMATITGRRLYLACGFADVEPVTHVFPNAVAVLLYRMAKTLQRPAVDGPLTAPSGRAGSRQWERMN